MNITAKVKDFSAELAAAMGCVETHTNLPVSGLISLRTKGSDLIISATNLDFGMRTRIPVVAENQGNILVDAGRLHGWVSKLVYENDEDISIKVTATRTSFKQNGSRFNLALANPENFPAFPSPGAVVSSIPAELLGALFSGVLPVIEDGENIGYNNYSGAQLTFELDGTVTAVATNGKRLAYSSVKVVYDGAQLVTRVVITRKAISELIKMCARTKGNVSFCATENNVFFSFGNRQMYCRKLSIQFPAWQKIMPNPADQKVARISSTAAISAISRVSSLSDKSKRISLEFKDGLIEMSSTSDLGDSGDSVRAEYSGAPYLTYVNSAWLTDALRAVGGLSDIAFTENDSQPLEIRSADSLNYRNIIAKMAQFGEK